MRLPLDAMKKLVKQNRRAHLVLVIKIRKRKGREEREREGRGKREVRKRVVRGVVKE